MSVILSHPTGNANVRAALNGLAEARLLAHFYTGIASFEGGLLDRLGALPPLSEIRRRRFDKVLKPLTTSLPLREAGRLLALKAGLDKLVQHETGVLSVDAVYRHHDRAVARRLSAAQRVGVQAVYTYEDGAEYSLAEARRLGMAALYDLPIGYWKAARHLLGEERHRWPEWSATLTGFKDSAQKLDRKDHELAGADAIFVASSFTKHTLLSYSGSLSPVHVIPYGFPAVRSERQYTNPAGKRRLKLLFVGGLSQRKGIADVFAVAEALLGEVELTVVGKKATDDCAALDAALSKHRWIPSLPHSQILELMREQDLFVFPSLFEGFGLVITEAMSQGLPVITTDRTAGPDLIQHGKNGWLIEAGSTEALQNAIEHFIEQPEELEKLGQAAQQTARERPWPVYGSELAEAIAHQLAAQR